MTFHDIANSYRKLNQPDSAVLYYSLALEIAREVGFRTAQPVLLRSIGSAYNMSGRHDSALVYFEKALPLVHELEDRSAEAATLNAIGEAFIRTGRADSALVSFSHALPLVRETGDRRWEGITLRNLGVAFNSLGRTDSALVYYRLGLAVTREVGDHRGEGTILSALGTSYRTLGQRDSALSYFTRALTFQREMGDTLVAALLNNVGSTYADIDRVDSALVYFARALQIARNVRNRGGEIATLINIAMTRERMGQTDSALAYLARARAVAGESGDHRSAVATIFVSAGKLHAALGRADSALSYYAQALALTQEIDDWSGVASTLLNIGSVYEDLGRVDSAMVYYEQANQIMYRVDDLRGGSVALSQLASVFDDSTGAELALESYRVALQGVRLAKDRRSEGAALGNIGGVQFYLGRVDSAFVYFTQALSIHREVHDRLSEAGTLASIGIAQQEKGRADSASVYLMASLEIFRALRERRAEAAVLMNIGFLYQAASTIRNLARAVAYYDSATAIIEEVSRYAGGDENRMSLVETKVNWYHLWTLAWLARLHEVGGETAILAALAASERGRAQALRELMLRNSASSVDRARVRVAGTRPGADLSAEARALALSLTRSGVPAVSYLVTPDMLLTFLIRPGSEVEVFRTAVGEDTLAALVAAVRAGLGVDPADSRLRAAQRLRPGRETRSIRERAPMSEDLDAWKAPAAQLSSLLFPAGLRGHLPASGELVVVPSGPLFLLPFAVLPFSQGVAQMQDSASSFGLRYAIRYVPSLQVLTELEAQPSRSRPTTDALVVGNPTMPRVPDDDGAFFVPSRLPGAEMEARWVAGQLGTPSLTGGQATEATVRARLGTATLVHLATHAEAYASDARARDSYVALASGAGEDGLLTVGEVLDEVAFIRAELVVLSACQTGLGDLKQAEGTVGLQRAFLARGAHSVLVSLWNVSDEATALLMQSFYTHWLGGATKAEALRSAEVEVADRFPHPRYWAAFQMVGAR